MAFVVLAACACAAYLYRNAPPACGSDEALGQVYAALHDQFHLESIFLNDIQTVSGGWFGNQYECSVEVAEIRGNVAASGMPWRAVRYRIVRRETAPFVAVTVTLGGSVPLASEPHTFWQRVLAYF